MKPITTGLLKKFYQKISTVFAKKSDLDKNGYDEVSGGKNLLKWIYGLHIDANDGTIHFDTEKCASDLIPYDKTKKYYFSKQDNYKYWAYIFCYDSNKLVINRTGAGLDVVSNGIKNNLIDNVSENTKYIRFCVSNNINANGTIETLKKASMKFEENDTFSSYEPYYPSNKMLDEENICQSREMIDIKMLGWSVPRECPIQNQCVGNLFIQNVNRVNLGSLALDYSSTAKRFFMQIHDKKNGFFNLYSRHYDVSTDAYTHDDGTGIIIEKCISGSNGINVYLRDNRYTSITQLVQYLNTEPVYLYYELATPVYHNIDGYEIYNNRKDTIINLLKPTLQTSTKNNITYTNNGDGTYTLNGTVPEGNNLYVKIADITIPTSIEAILLGSNNPKVGVYIQGDSNTPTAYGSTPKIIYNVDKGKLVNVGIAIIQGTTLENEVVKPMITTNLSATYEDFVPYTGDTGNLNKDVADIRSRVVNNLTTTEEGYMLDARQGKYLYDSMNDSFKSIECTETNYATISSGSAFLFYDRVCFISLLLRIEKDIPSTASTMKLFSINSGHSQTESKHVFLCNIKSSDNSQYTAKAYIENNNLFIQPEGTAIKAESICYINTAYKLNSSNES